MKPMQNETSKKNSRVASEKELAHELVEDVKNNRWRSLYMGYGNAAMNGGYGIFKFAAGLFSGSLLVMLHGLYSLLDGAAILWSVQPLKTESEERDRTSMKQTGWSLVLISVFYLICYVLSQGDLAWDGYTGWIAWAVLAVSVVELLLSLVQMGQNFKQGQLAYRTLAVLNLANSCISLALIVSCLVWASGQYHPSFLVKAAGITMGLVSLVLGLWLIGMADKAPLKNRPESR